MLFPVDLCNYGEQMSYKSDKTFNRNTNAIVNIIDDVMMSQNDHKMTTVNLKILVATGLIYVIRTMMPFINEIFIWHLFGRPLTYCDYVFNATRRVFYG